LVIRLNKIYIGAVFNILEEHRKKNTGEFPSFYTSVIALVTHRTWGKYLQKEIQSYFHIYKVKEI